MPKKSHRRCRKHHTEKDNRDGDDPRPLRHVRVDSNPREYFITTTVEEYAPLSSSSSESCQRKWSADDQLEMIRRQGFCSEDGVAWSKAPKDEFALLKDHLVDRNCVRAPYGYANDDGRVERPMLDEVELLEHGYVDTAGRRHIAEYPVLEDIAVNSIPISATSCTTVESPRHGHGRQRSVNEDHAVPKHHHRRPSSDRSKHCRHESRRHCSGHRHHRRSRHSHCRHDDDNNEDGRHHRHRLDRGHGERPSRNATDKKDETKPKDVMVEPDTGAVSLRRHRCSHHRRRRRDERKAARELKRKATLPHIHFKADAETTTARDTITSSKSKTSTSFADPIKIGSMVFEIDDKTNRKGESALLSYAIEENCRQYTLVSLIDKGSKSTSETLRVQTLELKFSDEISLLRVNRLSVSGGK